MNKQEGEDSFSSHKPIRPSSPSPPLTESDFYDGIVPGVLYSAGDGGIKRYVPKLCWSHGGPCSTSCELYENGSCQMGRLNSKDDTYRRIDNLISSSAPHPVCEQSEKSDLVEDALKREDVASLDTLPLPAPRIQWSVKDVEDTIDEM